MKPGNKKPYVFGEVEETDLNTYLNIAQQSFRHIQVYAIIPPAGDCSEMMGPVDFCMAEPPAM